MNLNPWLRPPGGAAPLAPARPHEFEVHGTRIRDDYAWLKAENWKEVLKEPEALPSEIRAYLEAENAYAQRLLASTKPLQERLYNEMLSRIKQTDLSVPYRDGE